MEERLRMCVACRQKIDKSKMKRVVKSSDGEIFIDLTGKKNGRGAYVCSSECMKKCGKAKQLNKAFKCEVSPEVYARLAEEFVGEQG